MFGLIAEATANPRRAFMPAEYVRSGSSMKGQLTELNDFIQFSPHFGFIVAEN